MGVSVGVSVKIEPFLIVVENMAIILFVSEPEVVHHRTIGIGRAGLKEIVDHGNVAELFL